MSSFSQENPIRSFHADIELICRQQTQQRAVLDAKTGRVLTYSALFESIQRFSGFFRDAGLGPSDRVFSVLPNSVDQLVAFLAAMWSGIDFCPISPLSTAEEIRRFILMSGSATGLVPSTIHPGIAESLQAACTKRQLISIDSQGNLRGEGGAALVTGNSQPTMKAGKLIVFTSGTTTSPKAIVLDGDRLWSSAVAWVRFHSVLNPESRFYNMLPMSYLGGLFNLGLIPLAANASVVVSDAFSAASALRFWREIEEFGVNVLWVSPTMIRTLLQLHRPVEGGHKPWERVQVSFLGMATARLDEKKQFESTFGIPLLENYALSETTFLTSEHLGDPRLRRSANSVGSVLPWAELRLRPLAEGEASDAEEIQVKTPYLFDGYLTSSGKIDLPLTSDGWFRTGDLGTLKDSQLVLKGRSKDIIKKGGYLVILSDLEEIAAEHAAVVEAVAVAVPHEFYGESSVLCLRLLDDSAVSPEQVLKEVKALLASKLAKFKWPTKIAVVPVFPRTDSGKVKKTPLSAQVLKGQGMLQSVDVH